MEDENSIISRFIELRKKHGPTQAKFGKLLGISDVSVSRIESGINGLSEQNIKLLCLTFGVNEKWLKDGKLPKYNEAIPGETEFLELFRKLSPESRKLALKIMAGILEDQEEKERVAEKGEELA